MASHKVSTIELAINTIIFHIGKPNTENPDCLPTGCRLVTISLLLNEETEKPSAEEYVRHPSSKVETNFKSGSLDSRSGIFPPQPVALAYHNRCERTSDKGEEVSTTQQSVPSSTRTMNVTMSRLWPSGAKTGRRKNRVHQSRNTVPKNSLSYYH